MHGGGRRGADAETAPSSRRCAVISAIFLTSTITPGVRAPTSFGARRSVPPARDVAPCPRGRSQKLVAALAAQRFSRPCTRYRLAPSVSPIFRSMAAAHPSGLQSQVGKQGTALDDPGHRASATIRRARPQALGIRTAKGHGLVVPLAETPDLPRQEVRRSVWASGAPDCAAQSRRPASSPDHATMGGLPSPEAAQDCSSMDGYRCGLDPANSRILLDNAVSPTVGVVIANHNNSDFVEQGHRVGRAPDHPRHPGRSSSTMPRPTDPTRSIRRCLSHLNDPRFRYIKLESNVGQGRRDSRAAWRSSTRRSSASSILTTSGTTTSSPGTSSCT